MQSSFKRGKGPSTTAAPKLPAGTRLSPHNGQLIVSTGLAEVDNIIGGGVTVGSSLLIEEDTHTTHSHTLLKYFLAQGIADGHSIMFITDDEDPSQFLLSLPPVSEPEQLSETPEESGGNLKIAWRYQESLIQRQKDQSVQTSKGNFSQNFDLSKTISPEKLQSLQAEQLSVVKALEGNQRPLESIYNLIGKLIVEHNTRAFKNKEDAKILRIGIQAFASPIWTFTEKEMICFLHGVKGLLRSSTAVLCFTFPAHIASPTFSSNVQHISDTVISLTSFAEGEAPEIFDELTGFFYIKKLPRFNSLTGFLPETNSYGYVRKRKKLYVEKLHLGPESSRSTATQASKEEKPISQLLCLPEPGSRSGASSLDF